MMKQQGLATTAADLLNLAADDDLSGFKDAVHTGGANPYEVSAWYHRHYALRKMGSHAVTPTMLASLYGSLNVLKFLLSEMAVRGTRLDAIHGAEKATPLHYAVAGGTPRVLDTIKLLLSYGADVNAVDAHGMRPLDVMKASHRICAQERVEMERLLLNGISQPAALPPLQSGLTSDHPILHAEKALQDVWRSHPLDSPSETAYTDVKNSIYTSDDFRMFSFKIRQCSRAYSHDWTECPFVHNGENARRRDPRKFHYSCVPCPDFRKGACRLGDACEYAHGIFESWLHPAQYRTRLCKDGMACTRRVCFFAHAKDELRPLYIASGSAIPSPRGQPIYDMGTSAHGPTSPSSLCLVASPFSPMQKPQQNGSPVFPISPEPIRGPWISPDLPTLHLPTASCLNSSPLQMVLNAKDVCGTQKSSLKRVFDMECASPPSPPLQDHFSALLMTPLQRQDMVSPFQEHAWAPLETNIQVPTLSNRCSPLYSQLRSRAGQVQGALSAAIQVQKSASTSLPKIGSPGSLCNSESQSEMNVHSKPLPCPITPKLSQCHSFSMSDWGSPTGKLEWGVQKEDLHRLRRLTSQGTDAAEGSAFCAASLNVHNNKEGGCSSVKNEVDSVLGFWLERMQLDEITT